MINNNNKNGKTVVLKQCRKCGEEKPATSEFFGQHPSLPDGLKNWCCECFKLYNAERYLRNKEKMNAQARAWSVANPDKVKDYQRTYRDKE